MEKDLKTQKIKYLLKNPVIIFSLLTFALAAILLIGTHFHVPDFYTDKVSADKAAQLIDTEKAREIISGYENIKYKIYNPIFQCFGISLVFLFLSLSLKIRTFMDLKNIKIFRNKKFIYSWINLSYIFYIIFWVNQLMIHLEQYVYNSCSDSFGIPYFNTIFTMLFFAIIYYPVINIIFFITFNTKISRKIYNIPFIIGIVYYLSIYVATFEARFSYWSVCLYLYLTISLGLFLTAIQVLREKKRLMISN